MAMLRGPSGNQNERRRRLDAINKMPLIYHACYVKQGCHDTAENIYTGRPCERHSMHVLAACLSVISVVVLRVINSLNGRLCSCCVGAAAE